MDKYLEKLVITIYPEGRKKVQRFEKYSEDEYLLEKLKVIPKYIRKPAKSPINLCNQIREKKIEIYASLEKQLSEAKAIKFYKSEKYTFAKEIAMLKDCAKTKSHHLDDILKYAKQLEEVDSPAELLKLKFDLDDIVPYKIKSFRFSDCMESNELGLAILLSSPLMIARQNISDKTKNMMKYMSIELGGGISELYEDLISLTEIFDMMVSYAARYCVPTNGFIKNNVFLWVVLTVGILSLLNDYSIRKIIATTLFVFVILVVNDLWFKKE